MKEYRLASWPELPAHFRHAGHRRVLSDMSQRHMTLAQLSEASGLKRLEVTHFIEFLEAGGHVTGRTATIEPLLSRTMRQVGNWFRRALVTVQGGP